MILKRVILSSVCVATLAATSLQADEKGYDVSKLPPAAAKTDVTYAADIQPIFVKSCYPCHGPKTPKPKGKLRVDTLEAVLKGGEDGKVVVPNDIAKSSLLGNVAYLGDDDDFMPPPKNKAHLMRLSADQVGLIRAWIEQGAK
jgi:hypothetical protein